MKGGWQLCPPELLYLIFAYMDIKDLVKCMLVSRKWRDVAEHIIEQNNLWPEVGKDVIGNNAEDYLLRSHLDLPGACRNFLLWNAHEEEADYTNVHTYEARSVKKMHVYRENLILVTSSLVFHYNIRTYSLIKMFRINECHDFLENDHIMVIILANGPMPPRLQYYNKHDPGGLDLYPSRWHKISEAIQLYRMDYDCCYFFTITCKLWKIPHNVSGCNLKFIARHYGLTNVDPAYAIHVYNEKVYMVTKMRHVWYADVEGMKFVKVCTLWVPNSSDPIKLVMMFDHLSYVVAVNTDRFARTDLKYIPMVDGSCLQCSDITCARQHGNMLLLGYSDGLVEIRIPKKGTGGQDMDPHMRFNVEEFHPYGTFEDYVIQDIDVCETKGSHTVFVRTRKQILQVHITYPRYLM